MKKTSAVLLMVSVLVLFMSCNSMAAIINGPDIGGFGTFRDENTGRVWLDLNSFFNQSTTSMVAAASLAGFTFATQTDVSELLDSLPLTNGEFASYRQIMGGGLNTEGSQTIWGSWYFSPTTIGTTYASPWDTGWNFFIYEGVGRSWDRIPFENTPYAVMNIWAYQDATSVPVPPSIWLLGLGSIGLMGVRRKLGNI
jgi:hypothetical protein